MCVYIYIICVCVCVCVCVCNFIPFRNYNTNCHEILWESHGKIERYANTIERYARDREIFYLDLKQNSFRMMVAHSRRLTVHECVNKKRRTSYSGYIVLTLYNTVKHMYTHIDTCTYRHMPILVRTHNGSRKNMWQVAA